MKKIEEKHYCDLCGKEANVYKKYIVDSYTFGFKPIEAVGIELQLRPFGQGVEEVCISCLRKAFNDEMVKTI